MLCPEIWNFKAPEYSFSSKTLQHNEKSHLNTINSFIYNHLVSVVLPDTFKVPQSLSGALSNDCDYYKLTDVRLNEFVVKSFINSFVNSGSLYVLSTNSRIDCDNCASITPQGSLILSLDKSTYQSLGLEGTVSHFHTRTHERYIVAIDLTSPQLKPGKPNYERIKRCLEKLCMNFIVTWSPPNADVCPSSVAKYFNDLGYVTKLCEVVQTSNTLYSVTVPSVHHDNHYEIVEWLGMVAVQGNLTDGAPGNFVTTYETPEPNQLLGQVRFLQWRGLFTANQIERLYDDLCKLNKSTWVAMYVQGFSDSPVAWKGEEHHYYTNGDNSYVFILTGDDVIVCTQKCCRKRYNNKRKPN